MAVPLGSVAAAIIAESVEDGAADRGKRGGRAPEHAVGQGVPCNSERASQGAKLLALQGSGPPTEYPTQMTKLIYAS